MIEVTSEAEKAVLGMMTDAMNYGAGFVCIKNVDGDLKVKHIDFEEIRKGLDMFDFGEAITQLKCGLKVARLGWNGKGIFLELQVPDDHSKMTSPYIYIDTTGLNSDNELAPKSCVPWLASQTDMLSEDWVLVE